QRVADEDRRQIVPLLDAERTDQRVGRLQQRRFEMTAESQRHAERALDQQLVEAGLAGMLDIAMDRVPAARQHHEQLVVGFAYGATLANGSLADLNGIVGKAKRYGVVLRRIGHHEILLPERATTASRASGFWPPGRLTS